MRREWRGRRRGRGVGEPNPKHSADSSDNSYSLLSGKGKGGEGVGGVEDGCSLLHAVSLEFEVQSSEIRDQRIEGRRSKCKGWYWGDRSRGMWDDPQKKSYSRHTQNE